MKLYKKLENDFSVKSNKKIIHYKDKNPLLKITVLKIHCIVLQKRIFI